MPRTSTTTTAYRLTQTERLAQRTDKRVDTHEKRLALAEQAIKTNAEAHGRMEKKLDSSNAWLRGIAGALVLALAMLVIGLATNTPVKIHP